VRDRVSLDRRADLVARYLYRETPRWHEDAFAAPGAEDSTMHRSLASSILLLRDVGFLRDAETSLLRSSDGDRERL
jgi:hypothetical protein